jgi:hypothetical protein
MLSDQQPISRTSLFSRFINILKQTLQNNLNFNKLSNLYTTAKLGTACKMRRKQQSTKQMIAHRPRKISVGTLLKECMKL